ncbi:hypothetical protein [Desulfurococcus mucosus]|uniref:V-type ATP synthase subunit H n=1 Tax=Desulfurococcus mucosus (strain ATCC 35584 / DSM 2162 / JCM 9187 / O7/1) TaxID=765177 RepID=E8RAJ6_DESM0|nr:hypothetical protein [Desulfurococcus mucosus]ADV64406.1 hypothetical protein Desmu_0087 [Desulfurococcus mucosus DSM 2162]
MESIKDIDEAIDNILKEAERKKLVILKEAEKKAAEILGRPIPVEEYRREAEAILAEAVKRRNEILEKARREAEEIAKIPPEKKRKAVEYIVRKVVGL